MPLKYANHVTGASYIISFGVGSAIVTVAALAAVNLAHTLRHRCVPQILPFRHMMLAAAFGMPRVVWKVHKNHPRIVPVGKEA